MIRFIRDGEMIETPGVWEHFPAQGGDIMEIEPNFWVICTHTIDHGDLGVEVCSVPYADNRPARYQVPADAGIPAPVRWGLNALGAYAKWADGIR